MARVCLILVAGLSKELIEKAGNELKTLNSLPHSSVYQPAFPAVTCTAQATLTTGATAGEHGIICNGLYTFGREKLWPELDLSNHAEPRRQVSFWEQSNTLLQRPRFWEHMDDRPKVAMLFWQQSMRGAADVVITPKPVHGPDGKTMTACWSSPGDLYPRLVEKLGPFPLHNYWSPMAGLPSSQWIAKSAEYVWDEHQPDLELVYVPQLDFNLMRLGPNHPAVVKDLVDVDGLLAPLAEKVRAEGGILIVAGDYGMNEVKRAAMPNLALRQAGLLATKLDEAGKVVVDYANSAAFVMVDHQIGHVYVKAARAAEVAGVLRDVEGVGKVLGPEEIADLGLANERSGDLVLLANAEAWLAHDWWTSDAEKPRWQFTVDIHSKPGFDPRELFFDPAKKCIAQDAALVKGSHGLQSEDPRTWPVLMGDVPLPAGIGAHIKATSVAKWLHAML